MDQFLQTFSFQYWKGLGEMEGKKREDGREGGSIREEERD